MLSCLFNWIQDRIRSGIAAAKRTANALAISPDSGRNQISSHQDLLALVAAGRSCRLIDRELGPSKKTVAEIVKRAWAERFTREPQRSQYVRLA